jgi:hypothetical protein
MKRIEIVAKQFGKDQIKILEIKNVASKESLPNDYFRLFPHVYSLGDDTKLWTTKDLLVIFRRSNSDIYTKTAFNEIVKLFKQCGENYNIIKTLEKTKPFVVVI